MGTVYLAPDRKHGRRVAIKVLPPELAAALGSERFLREIRIAAQLSHPHILPLHDSGEAAGILYYVMPHVEGESLRERLARTSGCRRRGAGDRPPGRRCAQLRARRRSHPPGRQAREHPAGGVPRAAGGLRRRQGARRRRGADNGTSPRPIPACRSELPPTPAPSRRPAAASSTVAPTSTAWGACCTRCWWERPTDRRGCWRSASRSRRRRSGASGRRCPRGWTRPCAARWPEPGTAFRRGRVPRRSRRARQPGRACSGSVRGAALVRRRLLWMAAGAAALALVGAALAFLPRAVVSFDPKRVVVAGFENRTGDSALAPSATSRPTTSPGDWPPPG